MSLNSYWYQIIWIFLCAGISALLFRKEIVLKYGVRSENWKWYQIWVVALPYVFWAATRPDAFGDTIPYKNTFANAPSTLAELPKYFSELTKDKGFYSSMVIFKSFLGNHVELFFFVLALIQMFAVVKLYQKYSSDFWFSFFIFVAITDYTAWMHNGIRQFLAATIVYLGTDWILEKKYIRLIILILFASIFHQSALLMIPFIFIIQGNARNMKTLLAILLCILACIYISRFTSFLDTALDSTQYTNVVTDWKEFQDNGTNPVRALVYAIPAIISILGIKWVRENHDPIINMSINASFLVAGLYLVSVFTSGIFIGRIPVYLSLYSNGILLPWEIEHIFNSDSAKLVKVIAVILYSAFFYFQMHLTWGLI